MKYKAYIHGGAVIQKLQTQPLKREYSSFSAARNDIDKHVPYCYGDVLIIRWENGSEYDGGIAAIRPAKSHSWHECLNKDDVMVVNEVE